MLCEKTSLQTTGNELSDNRILPREVASCDECPNETDCCCGIDLQNPLLSASLRICGTSDGTLSCPGGSPPSPCITISNGGQGTGLLDSTDPKHLFCMVPGNSFYLTNNSSSEYAHIYVGCIFDEINGQRLTVSIPPSETWYFETSESCITARCM